MPDLLAHVLLAYAVCRALSWRYEWMDAQYVTIGMAGAMVPDLAKVDLVLDGRVIESVVGIPFDWFALHTAGAVIVSVLISAVIVDPPERNRVVALVSVGAATHLVADALLRTPSGRSYSVLWPLTRYQPPTPGLYLSTEPGPTIFALVLAITVYLVTWYAAD